LPQWHNLVLRRTGNPVPSGYPGSNPGCGVFIIIIITKEEINMRKPFIAGNWKMFKTAEETVTFLNELKLKLSDVNDKDILVCPSYTSLSDAKKVLDNSNIYLGSQDIYYEEKGAFTGAISPLMVKEFCTHAIVGHSERREFFNESNEVINLKIKSALNNNIIPILCIGETKEERDKGLTKEVIKSQLFEGLKDISKDNLNDIIVAYEPVWAISRGDPNVKPATSDIIQEIHSYIRSLLLELFGVEVSENIRILYGGSVKSDNIKEYMSLEDVDGALVGGASLDLKFADIVKY
jgi:triosephosphate isomerase (TIM)